MPRVEEVTFTEIEQEALAAREPPVRLNEVSPVAGAKVLATPQLLVAPTGFPTVTPAGKGSTICTLPLVVAVVPLLFCIVMVSTEVPFGAMLDGANVLVTIGLLGVTTNTAPAATVLPKGAARGCAYNIRHPRESCNGINWYGIRITAGADAATSTCSLAGFVTCRNGISTAEIH